MIQVKVLSVEKIINKENEGAELLNFIWSCVPLLKFHDK